MNILGMLAWKNLKRNRKRTTATMIGIIVSVALISFIFTLICSFQSSMIEAAKRNRGNYHIHINQTTTEKAIEFNQMQDRIEKVGISQTIGAADYKTQLYAKQGIRIEGYDETSLLNRDIRLIEGRMPRNEKEIVISNYLVNNMNEPIKIGDTLTLEVQKVKLTVSDEGKREDLEPDGVETITYTITGIMKQTAQEAGSSNSYIAITKLERMTKRRPCEVTILLKNPKDEGIFYQELSNSSMQNRLSENTELLLWQGATNEMNEKSQIELIAAMSTLIVVSITIVLIRNSFQISISERMKEFGTLISIGATAKQIRKIVLAEGVIYVIISIPIGLILGVGVVFFSANGIGNALEEMLGNDWIMQFSINGISILATVVLTILSIFISCIKPIKEAQKASPIETIRQNTEIAIKNKDVKISKWKSKLLGIEREIAYKNIKRNKRKYRSTTISISIIMILVILVSSIIQYVFTMVNDVYIPTGRNIDVGIIHGYGQEETSTIFKSFDRIKQLDNIIDYSINVHFEGKIKENSQILWIYAYEGKTYEEYLKRLGLKYEDTINAGILLSKNPSKKEGEVFNIIIKDKEYQIPIIKITNLDPYIAMTDLDSAKIEKLKENNNYYSNTERLIIPNDMAKNIDIDDGKNSNIYGHFDMDMRINSSNPNQLEREIGQFINLDKMVVNNYTKQKEDAQRLSIIMSIFLYGLLLVISLIGITNIYNTITASMSLRKREFETLRAIGMSNKQFNKMFSFESLLYSTKSLIIGTILGIVLSYGIYIIISANQAIQYYFPIVQMIVMMVLTVMVIYISTKVAQQKR
ncbi:MAG: FtsX-like permease family protein [Clostridia bacterium]|nr:FtsX-like permease family protein [Clostridia bacterium]